jgi:hypothetical protein
MSQFLTVRYDVTGWDDDQITALIGEALVQAEASDDHPDCEATAVVGPRPAFEDLIRSMFLLLPSEQRQALKSIISAEQLAALELVAEGEINWADE